MSAQVARTFKAAYFQLKNTAKIRQCPIVDACKTIVHALVTSKVGDGNAVLFRVNGRLSHKLQMVQHSAGREVTRQQRRDHLHITPVMIAIHWLPIRWRIIYKLLVLTFRTMHDLAPAYIADMISPYKPSRKLCSAGSCLLTVHRHNLERCGRRGFSVTAPRLWNDLLDCLPHILFKCHL